MSRLQTSPSLVLFLLGTLGLTALTGCGPKLKVKLGSVSGKVTLGGQPLADALVTFSPVDGKSPSFGKTDSNGAYTLSYVKKIKGAEVGEHIVTLSTFVAAMEDPPTPEIPEKVPFKYRDGSDTLKQTVKSGGNTVNLDLEPGPIEDPAVAAAKAKAKAGGRKAAKPGCQ